MLEFKISKEEQQIIDNTNLLVHIWEPLLDCNSRILSNEGILTLDAHERVDFQNDLMSLTILCEDFNALLQKRANALKAPFIPSLQAYYALGQRYQGLITLAAKVTSVILDKCYDFLSHVHTRMDKLSHVEQEVMQTLADLLMDKFRDIHHSLLELTASKQLALTEILMVYGQVTLENGEVQETFEGRNIIQRRLLIGEFTHNGSLIHIKAQLQAHFSPTIPSPLTTFSNVTNFHFHSNNSMYPIIMSIYPQFSPEDHAKPSTLQQFFSASNDAHAALKTQIGENQSGRLHYQSPQLAVALSGPFAQAIYASKLPFYFQAMVEIAKNHRCHQVVLYAPYDFADIAFAFGFHSREHSRTEASQQCIDAHLASKSRVTLLPASSNRYENNHELMQPLYFPLDAINTRKVYFTENGEVTTYAELIKKLTLLKRHSSNAILPDPYQLMARPFCPTLEALKKRELTGKAIKTDVASYANEMLDVNWLKGDKELVSLGEGSHIASPNLKSIFRITT